MALTADWHAGPDGMPVYMAQLTEAAGARPIALVIQEVWGVDAHIQDVTRRLAAAGYLAIAPDLYAPDGTRPAVLSPERVEAVKHIVDHVRGVDWHDPQRRRDGAERLDPGERDDLLATLDATLPATRDLRPLGDALAACAEWGAAHDAGNGHVAAVGFCLGGALVADLADREATIDAGVIFYGYLPDEPRSRPGPPLLGMFGADDPHVIETVEPFRRAVHEGGGRIEVIVYPDAPHAFFNDDRPGYRPGSARHAWARTLSFLDAELP